MAENIANYRANIKPGIKVEIVQKKDYKTGSTVEGVVGEVLTKSQYHPYGIKVRLIDGTVGRVKRIIQPDDNTIKESRGIDNSSKVKNSTFHNDENGKTTFAEVGENPDIGSKGAERPKDYRAENSSSQGFDENTGAAPQVIEGKLNPYRNPVQTTIRIKESETGYSYKNLFYPYVRDAKKIIIRDAYIRKDYQIKNLVAFCSILPEKGKDEPRIEVLLITGLEDDAENRVKQIEKLEELKKALLDLNIDFRYEFDNTLHDRSIETDTGWRIVPGRGLDIFQDPGTYYSPVNFDQTKRKCKQTDIDFIKRV